MCTYSMRSVLGATLIALVMGLASPVQAATGGQVVGYYDVFNGQQGIAAIQWNALTVLNLAFIGIDPTDNRCAWMPEDGSSAAPVQQDVVGTVRAIVAARNANNPNVKIVLTVGGWTLSHQFSRIAGDPQAMSTLAQSCGLVVKTLQLDGLDVDWEYPTRLGAKNCPPGQSCASSNDADNFALLLSMMRSSLPSQDSLLTAAVYYDPSSNGIGYNVGSMNAYLDHFNIMAYDMANPQWHPATANHAAIGASTQALEAFAAAGASKSKLNLGVPFYGYIWQQVPSAAPGALACGAQDATMYTTATLLARYSDDAGCALQNTADGDSYFCATGDHAGEWAAIETVRSLATKAHYVRDHGFGGMMSWETSQDSDGSLTNVMASEQQ